MTDYKARVLLIASAIIVTATLGFSMIFVLSDNSMVSSFPLTATLVAIGSVCIVGFFALTYNFLFVKSFSPVQDQTTVDLEQENIFS
jgi:hypothetical protein